MKIVEWYKNLPKNFKILFWTVCGIVLLDIVLLTGLIAGNKHSSLQIGCTDAAESSSLIALNSNAKKSLIKANDYAYFKFTEAQKDSIKAFYKDHNSVAVLLRVKVYPTTKQSLLLDGEEPLNFEYGLLNESDFTEKGKFKKQIYPNTRRIVIQGDERKSPETFDISFAVQRNENIDAVIPKGFFINSALRCRIVEAAIAPAQIGFDVSGDIPYYGFGYNGGKLDFENRSFDFSGATMVFPVKNTSASRMPEFTVKLSDNEEYKSTLQNAVYTDFNFGGEKIYLKNVKAASKIKIPSAGLKAPFSRMEITNNSGSIKAVLLNNVSAGNRLNGYVIDPVKTDPGLILQYKQSNWRCDEYELYQWDRFPEILIFDTKNLDIQGKIFTRLAYFVEKEGYKGRLVSDEELEGKHGYNAHDYKAADLARFFNTAEETNFILNSYEMLLKQILIRNGILESDGNKVHAVKGEIMSVSKETPEWSRVNLIAHEAFHMIFFMDEEFRNYVSAVYHTCDPETLAFLIDYFKSQPSLGYDTNDEYLMYTEFMSYVMEQKNSEVAKNFVKKANWASVSKFTPELCDYIKKTEGRGFEDISNALNDFVFDKFGIVSGNVGLLSRY